MLSKSFKFCSTRWSEKFCFTLRDTTTCHSFTNYTFLLQKRSGCFFLSDFVKTEGNQKKVKNSVSSYSTSRSPHPCAVEIAHASGQLVQVNATLHRKKVWKMRQVWAFFLQKQQFLVLNSERQLLKNQNLTGNFEVKTLCEKV